MLVKTLIFNIQKFSIHDGPGVRTTVFFKGCPIKCAWCHNPESQNYEVEEMMTKDGELEIVGREYSVNELVHEIKKDIIFYDDSGGGVTLSGGECLSQDINYLLELVQKLSQAGISVAIDTCGVVDYEVISKIIPYVDIFLYDLKFIDSQLHQQYTGASNKLVLDNLIKISNVDKRIALRLILLDGINTTEDTTLKTIEWLKANNIHPEVVNLLPYHAHGRDKYRRLNRQYDNEAFVTPTDETLNSIARMYTDNGFTTTIGG